MQTTMRTPAKVNLCLLVGPKEDTGYHEVFTVFAPIDVYDELEFDLEASSEGGIPGELCVECDAAPGENNLAARALRALGKHCTWSLSGRVRINKGIPMGAGLGGGSADAAAALVAGSRTLAEAGGPVLSEAELAKLARSLGADVAFFLHPAPAIGRGIGELLEPLNLPGLHLVLVFSDRMLSTARVYRSLDILRPIENRSGFEVRTSRAERCWRQVADAGRVSQLLDNDLEQASFDIMPSLAVDREVLVREGALGSLMSGSGPTLFGVCESEAKSREVAGRLLSRGYQTRAATVLQVQGSYRDGHGGGRSGLTPF